MQLTVAIPTFNRNETLRATLAHLLPQLGTRCRLVILDNHSDTPVEETLRPLLAQHPEVNVRIIRQPWNLGATANIVRCFEYCQTEWAWLLGDDDVVSANALDTILSCLAQHPEADYLNFITDHLLNGFRTSTILTTGLADFVQHVESAHHINFMSCSLWRVARFTPQIAYAYNYAYSMGWSWALLLTSLRSDGRTVLSRDSIIDAVTTVENVSRWSYRKFILGWCTLLELPMDGTVRKVLARKMLGLQSPENVAAYLLADRVSTQWPDNFFYYDLARARLAPQRVHRLAAARFAAYRLLFIHPPFGWWLVRTAIRMANRAGLKSIDIADLEGRGDT